MSVNVEIKRNISITVQDIASLKDLNYGVSDNHYNLEIGEIGKHTILYDSKCIGRGFELSFEESLIVLRLTLPTTCYEIELFYELVKRICEKMNVDIFIRDDEIVSLERIDNCVEADVDASLNAIKNIDQSIREKENHSMILFGALNPIELGLKEVDEIDCSLIQFEKLMNRLQQKDVYYATPKYYQRKDGSVFGVYFIGEKIVSIVPNNPKSPFFNIEQLDSHYVRIPDKNDIPYEDFIQHVDKLEDYDNGHIMISLDENKIHELSKNYAQDMTTKDKVQGLYFGKTIDRGMNHLNKIRNLELNIEEWAAFNHLAVFLRWMGEHHLLSEKLIQELPTIHELISDKTVDLRKIIIQENVFDCKLCIGHFNDLGKDFAMKFYVFNNENGYPACVDKVAEEYFGTEKYNSEEYKNEAYLFVPYDEDYYTKLSKYIDESFNEYIKNLK